MSNKTRLSEAMVDLAKRQVLPLARDKHSKLDKLVAYLCEGGDQSALLTVAGTANAAGRLRLVCVTPSWEREGKMDSNRCRFFERAGKEAPDLAYRFAKIAEAAAGDTLGREWEALPEELRWFDVLVNEALEISAWRARNPLNWDILTLESILEVGGHSLKAMASPLLVVSDYDYSMTQQAILAMPGVVHMLDRYPDVVNEALLQKSTEAKVHVIKELQRLKVDLVPHIDRLASLVMDSAKVVQQAAKDCIGQLDQVQVQQALEQLASSGSAPQRRRAVRVLRELFGDAVSQFLDHLAEQEKNQKVRQEIDKRDTAAEEDDVLNLPEVACSPSVAISEAAAEAFTQAVKASDTAAERAHARNWDRTNPKRRRGRRSIRGHRKAIQEAINFLRNGGRLKQFANVLKPAAWNDATWRPYRELVSAQDLTLVGMWRLLHMLGCSQRGYTLSQNGYTLLLTYRLTHAPELDLRHLAAAANAARLNKRFVATMYLPWRWGRFANALELAPDAIWPFFAEHPVYLEEALGIRPQKDADYWELAEERRRGLRLLALFPQVSDAFLTAIWGLARGSDKTARSAAATWLAEQGYDTSTLDALGHSADFAVNRKGLLEDAQAGLGRTIPAAIAWFPGDRLPVVHWQDNEQVAPEILRWFVVQACSLKSIEPSPAMRKCCDQMRLEERHTFGNFVFQSWVSEDTKPRYTEEEAAAAADRDATWYSRVYSDPEHVEDYRNRQYKQYLDECAGGASGSRGVLALVACCADSRIVAQIEQYLKTYSSSRRSQCKLLLGLLAQLDQALATQQLLAIGSGFGSDTLQKEAARLVNNLAKRKGWTRDQLADCSIPSAGFGQDGQQEIDYGTRQFQARLGAHFKVILSNAEGETIAKLPPADEGDDDDAVKAARDSFFSRTRGLKQVRKLQQERLYEAMCTRRAWRFEDWNLYLNRHPIVGRFCARLVWMGAQGDHWITFRPRADRSLATIDDQSLEFAANDTVMLAHSSELSDDACKAWLEQFDRQDVRRLFEQFSAAFTLPKDQTQDTEISDFQGHMIPSSSLRHVLNRLNYTRGRCEGGVACFTYHKHFPSLRLQAVIEFTGSDVSKDDSDAALVSLYFEDLPESSDHYRPSARLALGQLPAVLLSECWHDLKRAAEAGTGFDEDWERKSGPAQTQAGG